MPESELIELDGKAWCRFHLPLRVGAVDSEKTRWSTAQCAAFNQTVLDLIEEAKKKEEVADLSGVVFPTDISLACEPKEQSPLPAVFIQAIFGGRADFRHVVFPRHRSSMPSFDLATFTKIARFDRATFCDVAAFENVTFADRTSFDAATFEKNAHFHSASFAKEASFSDAVFRGNVEFHHANFGDVVWFSRSKFAWSIYFRDAIFGGDFHFEGDTSLGYADAIPGLAAFHRATFARRAIFNNRSFLNTTEFGGAIFEVAPEFHNSVFHQDTSFAGTQFRDREGLHGVDSARAYRTLKLAMESVRARSEESQFYAYEQHALRGGYAWNWVTTD